MGALGGAKFAESGFHLDACDYTKPIHDRITSLAAVVPLAQSPRSPALSKKLKPMSRTLNAFATGVGR
ncbi:MAG: hypothetical protein JWQ87_865 [Candidatus Sulfotelmatobacter sp.]|nr:hypothetical protein [Candidatus Sulfotelmatobacter sp.]